MILVGVKLVTDLITIEIRVIEFVKNHPDSDSGQIAREFGLSFEMVDDIVNSLCDRGYLTPRSW